MSPADYLTVLAKQKAADNGIDPALVCAICEQESGWDPWAVRFEPAFYTRYILPMKNIRATEAYTRAMSFGLMQIMGQTARELGYADTFLTGLCHPPVALDYGCKKLTKCLTAAAGDVEKALLRYNGGSNAEYGRQVMARMAKYQ
jgi:soluble lytic murein transglycosylase-like protein